MFRSLVTSVAVFALTSTVLGAQSLIVGIPNAEVSPNGAIFLTHESQIKTDGSRDWNTFQFLTYGIGHGTELAFSAVNFGRPQVNNRVLALGFKTVFEGHSGAVHRWQLKGTFGAMVPKSIDDRSIGVWAYSSGSFRVPSARTRVTVGPTYGTPQLFGIEKIGMMAGIEQPIGKRFAVIADWYSGVHDLAAAIPALQINLPHDFVFIAGYKIPNRNAPGGRALVIEVAGILARLH